MHKYGAHIFHTSNKEVWDFVNSIVPFRNFINTPLANYKGELYNLPFNMNTFCKMWQDVHTTAEAQARIDEQKVETIAALNGREPQNLEEQAISLVGKDIYLKLIKEYTEKQWGRDCKELPTFIIKRLPVRMTFNNNYFNDKYQGIPIGGYNKLIEGLLKGVETKVNFDFFKDSLDSSDSCSLKENWQKHSCHLVYTGAIDEYFDYKLGKLDWRSVNYKTRIENTPNYQGNAVVNYTSHDVPYTRVIEHKHFEMSGQDIYDCPQTVVSEEYFSEYQDGLEPSYPVNDDKNNLLVESYRQLAHDEGVIFPDDIKKEGWGEAAILFGGRLGEYKYYDMAPIIEQVLSKRITF